MGEDQKSPYSYGVAIILCGVIGVLGVHHLYLRNWGHALLDVALIVLLVALFLCGHWAYFTLVMVLSAMHSIAVFYLLIVERWRDGQGRLVSL